MPKKVIDFLDRSKGVGLTNMSAAQKRVFDAHGHFCHYCGSQQNLVIDHITPKSKGGSNDFSNLVPSCFSCNSSKGNKDYDDFIDWLEAERGAFHAMMFCGDCI